MKCPICSSDSQRKFEVKNYWIRDCLSCDHRFTELLPNDNHIEEIYDDSYFNGGGAGYADYLAEKDLLIKRGEWYAKLVSDYVETGKVLDVGAAAGFLLKGLTEKGWKGTGVEPNRTMAEFGRKNLNLNIETSSVETYNSPERFDLVTMIQVMAHFKNPREVLIHVSDMLKTNGFLLIETWNRNSYSEKIFGTKWHEYSPPSVLQFFSDESLNKLAFERGFEHVASGRPSKWISVGHARSLIIHKYGVNSFFSKLFEIFPSKWKIPYPSEDLFWVIYKKSH
ncbi:MAG: class I SAM-dependent methyltransferase [Pyrinomonadaceae bacterium]